MWTASEGDWSRIWSAEMTIHKMVVTGRRIKGYRNSEVCELIRMVGHALKSEL